MHCRSGVKPMQMCLRPTNQKLLRSARTSAIPYQIRFLEVLMESHWGGVFGYLKRSVVEETLYEIAHHW